MIDKMSTFEKRMVNINGDLRERVIYQRHLAEDLFDIADGVIAQQIEAAASGILGEHFVLAAEANNAPNPHYIYSLDVDVAPDADGVRFIGAPDRTWSIGYINKVVLSQDPEDDLEAATKQYVDNLSIATSFLELTDTPSSYVDASASGVRVNSAGSGLEFFDLGDIGHVVSRSYYGSFTDADLISEKLLVNHSLGISYPHVIVYDNNNNVVIVDVVYVNNMNIELDLVGFAPISGEWNVRVAAGGGGSESFVGLEDVPDSYVGMAASGVRVRESEDGLEFFDVGNIGAGGGLQWRIVSSDITAIRGNGYLVDVSGGNVTLTLPSSPSEGDTVGVSDYTKSAELNVITVSPGAEKIEGRSSDMIVDITGSGFTLVYSDATIGWKIVTEIAGGGSGSSPVGTVVDFAGASAPSGWLMCDGATVSQTTYAALYAVIGHTYGADPGGGNFILPNAAQRVTVGKHSSGTFDTLGKTGGAETHQLTVAELAAHTHTVSNNAGSPLPSATSRIANSSDTSHPSTQTSSSTGSNAVHNNLQPYIVFNKIIKT